MVVTDRHGSPRELVDTVQAILDAGGRWIWFRERDMAIGPRRDLAEAVARRVRAARAFLTIGGDPALAAEIGADGVHLGGGQGEAIPAARSGRSIGVSTHSLAEVEAALLARADYATFSPIFASASKPGYGPALGLASIEPAARSGLPIIALGGIGADEAAACLAAGAWGVAVMGGLMRSDDPAAQTRRLLARLGGA